MRTPRKRVVTDVKSAPNEPGLVAKSAMGAAADRLTEVLRKAEDMIRAQGFGVHAAVKMDTQPMSGPGPSTEWVRWLSFGKVGNRWGLSIEEGPDDDPDAISTTDLFTSSIDARKAAAQAIPNLLKALIKARDGQILETENLVHTLAAIVEVYPTIAPEKRDDFLESARFDLAAAVWGED